MIIFINGTISSGKSTIAKLISKKLLNTAVIEVDELRNFIEWMPLEESIPLNLGNTVSIIKNFVEKGLNVVIPYPLSEKNYRFFIDALDGIGEEIHVVTLRPDVEKLIIGNRGRTLDEWERDRIIYHTKIGLTNPSFGIIIDNTDQKPEETVELIMKSLNR